MGKQPTLLSTEEGAELKRLYADLAHESGRATAFLRASGTSAEFLRADREVTRIVKRIKEILALLTNTGWRFDVRSRYSPRCDAPRHGCAAIIIIIEWDHS